MVEYKTSFWTSIRYTVFFILIIFSQDLYSESMELEKLWLSDNPEYVTLSAASDLTFTMHRAAVKGKVGIIRELVNKGYNINKRDKSLLTPLHHSVKKGKYKVTELLLKNKADVNAEGGVSIVGKRYRQIPLHIAAMKGDFKSMMLLIKFGSNINRADNEGNTPLYYSVSSGDKRVMEFLLTKGADPNIKSNDNILPTALFKAVALHNKQIIELLIKNGADLFYKNSKKQTPFDYAQSCNMRSIADYLDKMMGERKEDNKQSFFRKIYQLIKKDPFF